MRRDCPSVICVAAPSRVLRPKPMPPCLVAEPGAPRRVAEPGDAENPPPPERRKRGDVVVRVPPPPRVAAGVNAVAALRDATGVSMRRVMRPPPLARTALYSPPRPIDAPPLRPNVPPICVRCDARFFILRCSSPSRPPASKRDEAVREDRVQSARSRSFP